MVCDVFVCRMWKAGGLFDSIDNKVNCAEFTNKDAYQMNILDAAPSRPAACVKADPKNSMCQIMGKYTLEIDGAGTKAPYKHMAEHCESAPPLYKETDNC